MGEYENAALDAVREYARMNNREKKAYLKRICEESGVDAAGLINRMLAKPITINFHIDRIAGNGKTVIENLTEQGMYLGQFQTGTSNGMLGGSRPDWERRIFFDVYPAEYVNRPKYGALNVFHYIDGASARFGSCCFQLKKDIVPRCTFSYGDSSAGSATLCTYDTFEGILADLFRDVEQHCRMLNQAVSSRQDALAILLYEPENPKNVGRNLDFCIEAHVHGELSLKNDVDRLYVDGSYRNTELERQIDALCRKFEIEPVWIPERRIRMEEIPPLFRGPEIPELAKKIDAVWGRRKGIINAYLIGKASADSFRNADRWKETGDPQEVFQQMKQLWHTVAYFG